MITFQHPIPSFYLRLLFSVVRARLALLSVQFLPAPGSVRPFILTQASLRFRVLNVRQVLCILSHPPFLCGGIDVRTVPQGVKWKLTWKGKRKEKWERWMDGGRGVGLHLMLDPSKASRRIKADHGQPDAASPCHPQGIHPSACFGRLLHPVVFFLPNFLCRIFCFGLLQYVHNFKKFELWRVPIVKTFNFYLNPSSTSSI